MSRALIIGLIVIAVVIVACCLYVYLFPSQSGNTAKFDRTFTVNETQLIETRVITLEELKTADGKDGRPAYIAIAGIVYDVSSYQSWVGGEHHKLQAGQELTDEFLQSGHGVVHLQKLPVVGRLEKATVGQ